MKDYSPKRRTAVVFAGCGTAGAYHAGVLRALDESGVKVDLVVGSGVGTVAASLAAVSAGPRLYGEGGFWHDIRSASLYRLRPAVAIAVALLTASFGVFLLPIALALLAGLLFPLVLIADLVMPGGPVRLLTRVSPLPDAVAAPYLATLAIPIFALSIFAVAFVLHAWARDRRRFAEAFEAIFDVGPGERRLRAALWETARGAALHREPPSSDALGERYVALLAENLGQPGFRELILNTSDLETGRVLPFVVLQGPWTAAFRAARSREGVRGSEGRAAVVDLRDEDCAPLFFAAAFTGLLPATSGPVARVSFPRGGLHGGETHRLTDANLVGGCGLAEALHAGADQVILVTAQPDGSSVAPRGRGARARMNGALAALERACVERERAETERLNRVVETLGHRTEDGRRAWQDPATGRLYRDVALYVIRPSRRTLLPLDLDGARDAASEVLETPKDLEQRGYDDAYRLFVEPVVGGAPGARGEESVVEEEKHLTL